MEKQYWNTNRKMNDKEKDTIASKLSFKSQVDNFYCANLVQAFYTKYICTH